MTACMPIYDVAVHAQRRTDDSQAWEMHDRQDWQMHDSQASQMHDSQASQVRAINDKL